MNLIQLEKTKHEYKKNIFTSHLLNLFNICDISNDYTYIKYM